MFLRNFTVLFFLAIAIRLNAQVPAGVGGLGLKQNTRLYKAIPAAPLQKDGVYFINETYFMGNLTSYNHGDMKSLPMKYDLFRNHMEVIIKEQKFGLNHNYIKTFDWYNTSELTNSIFVNCREYQFPGNRLTGFFEVVIDGPVQLLFKKHVQYYKGTDSHSIMGLHKQGTITVVGLFYLGRDDKVFPISRNRKPNYRLFQGHDESIKDFVKQNRLSFRRRGHLKQIFSFYNGLL